MPIYIKYNFNKIFNVSLILLILLVLSSCSSLQSLKFWDDGEIDLDEPRPLKNIINNENIKINWDISFSGNNSLGNFEPSITSKSIFFADSNGTVSSINKLTGNINWKKQINSLSSGISAGFGILVIADTSGNVISWASAGQKGVERALSLYQSELERDMKLMGCTSIKELNRSNIKFR